LEVEGQDLFVLERTSSERPLYGEGLIWGPEQKMVQTAEYKLILDPYTDGAELYDRGQDPRELHNVAMEKGQVVQALRADLQAWLEHVAEVAATLPRSEADLDDPWVRDQLQQGGY
jgi:hypothetical protein